MTHFDFYRATSTMQPETVRLSRILKRHSDGLLLLERIPGIGKKTSANIIAYFDPDLWEFFERGMTNHEIVSLGSGEIDPGVEQQIKKSRAFWIFIRTIERLFKDDDDEL